MCQRTQHNKTLLCVIMKADMFYHVCLSISLIHFDRFMVFHRIHTTLYYQRLSCLSTRVNFLRCVDLNLTFKLAEI
jgi:hypothetical protein